MSQSVGLFSPNTLRRFSCMKKATISSKINKTSSVVSDMALLSVICYNNGGK